MQKLSRHISRGLSGATLLALGVLQAQAHPGHSLLDATTTHLASSPYHVTVLVLSGVTLCFGARLVQRRWPRHLFQAAGAIALASAVAIWTSHI